ncbi:MAG TPA: SEC-C metal-binding domain-containing protein [Thermoanaerobaculia bacterium]
MRTGRNEPCPCGSGNKYKNCCIGEQSRQATRYVTILVAIVATIALAGLIPSLLGGDEEEEQAAAASASRTPRAGKVWSEEHGHWHDAAAPVGGAPISPAMTPLTPAQRQQQQQSRAQPFRKPQPPGPAPEGKVWSPEHGHWHDVKK